MVLESISSPADLKALPPERLVALAQEIRSFLVASVSRTGGHLGPNLGVVELTIALHRVFDSPRDTLIFDTGHQSYVHKILTGRRDFSALRQRGGLSGYPSRLESDHDVVENSHASTSISWAEGIAVARRLRGESHRHTVAVIGDGALTGGMAWEALNHVAADKTLPLIVVVNDNERSYAPTIGGLAEYLATLRTTHGYERVLEWGKSTLSRTPVVGQPMYEALHGVKRGLKDMVYPQGLFEDLGLKYIGPVNGHDEPAIEAALRRARDYSGPSLVHVMTQKGRGYAPATEDDADRFHGVDVINPETGLPLEVRGRSWTDEFSEAIVELGHERPEVVALTAAMLIPVGLREFAETFPDRVYDVGIAEQHATTMAAGLSYAGCHPVFAVYATFLNRAFDQVLMDCALHRQGVTFVLDRAGVTGNDGASHNGMWDMSLLGVVPGLRLAAPRDGNQLQLQLREALAVSDAPTVLRFPKGSSPAQVAAIRRDGTVDVLRDDLPGEVVDVLMVSVGAMAPVVLAAADRVAQSGLSVRVVDPRWVLPTSSDLVAALGWARAVAVVEDGVREGGVGASLALAAADASHLAPVRALGLPREFLNQGSRAQVLADHSLTEEGVAQAVVTWVASVLQR